MHELIKEIRAIAQIGREFTKDPYDRIRYERLLEVSNQLYALSSDVDIARIERFFFPEDGYATPKIDLRACVVRDGRVLLVRERSDGKWTLPGGYADQNESPRQGITREVKEESGYDVEVVALYAIKDRDLHPYTSRYPLSQYKLFFTARVIGGAPADSVETSEATFFDARELPELSGSRVLRDDIIAGLRAFEAPDVPTWCD